MIRIGVLGGYGNVGIWVLRLLHKENKYGLKVAGRNARQVGLELKKELEKVEWLDVDVDNDIETKKFVEEVDIVVNCLGPSAKYSKRIAAICWKHITKYVDVGHIKPSNNLVSADDRLYIYAAGTAPGLSALLCKYMARQYKLVTKMIYVNAMSGVFSLNAAWDYLDGITSEHNTPMLGGNDCQIDNALLSREDNAALPFISGPADLIPYYDKEAQDVIKTIQPKKAAFYVALPGKQMRRSVEQASILFAHNPDRAVQKLVQASKVNHIKGNEFLTFLVEISGVLYSGSEKVQTLVLKTKNPSALTGEVAGIVTDMIAEDEMNKGIYPLGEFENNVKIVERLKDLDDMEQLHIYDSDLDSLSVSDEGEI